MNIKVNKRLMIGILSTTMGISLCGCDLSPYSNVSFAADEMTFAEVLDKAKDNTLSDEVLASYKVDRVNPFSLEYSDSLSLTDAGNYLEKTLLLSQRLNNMREIPILTEEDSDYTMAKAASNWSDEEVSDLISNYTYCEDYDDVVNYVAKLSYYKTYLDRELRTNGVNIATELVDKSIKSKVLDIYDLNVEDIDNVEIIGSSIFYNNKRVVLDNTYLLNYLNSFELELLSTLDSIKYNGKYVNNYVDSSELITILQDSLDGSKTFIYNEQKKNSDVKVKSL